jgi:hypothetical protein
LRRGEGTSAAAANVHEQLVRAILALAQTCHAARAGNAPLPPDAAESLAHLVGAPAPFGAIGSFLQAIAAGQPVPPLPTGLPADVTDILQALVAAIKQ